MARQSHCARLVAFWHTDPRFRLVGKMAAYVWLDLALMMERLGTPEGLCFAATPGSAVGSELGSIRELADLLRLEETDFETHLEPLVRRGLLRRDPSGALLLPEALAPSAKAKAARINGLKGGRPRKDGSPPGQRAMMLPLAGQAVGKPMGNPSGARAPESDDDSDRIKESSSMTAAGRDARCDTARHDAAGRDALGSEVARLAGLALTPTTARHVDRWLAQGAAPELVLRTVREVMGRVPPGTVISSLKYFDRPILGAIGAVAVGDRLAAAATRAEPDAGWAAAARAAHERDFAAWLARWGTDRDTPPDPPTLDAYLARARAEAERAPQAPAAGTEVAA